MNATLPNFSLKTQNSLNNIQIRQSEIIDVMKTLITNKACREDQISNFILKKTNNTVAIPLKMLFNRSLNECHFPSQWKSGTVMPLLKKFPSEPPSNYRPISFLSCVANIIFKHIFNFFLTNNLIYRHQSGFLPGHSTVYQLINLYNQTVQSIDGKQYTCMVFCDVSKAFDRVYHKDLIFKLQQNGITGKLLSWISSYLSERKQKFFFWLINVVP